LYVLRKSSNFAVLNSFIMLNRPLIRTKVVQNLYSYYQQADKTNVTVYKDLNSSCAETYDLYHLMLQLISEITREAELRTEALKEKFFATEEERNPRMNFVNNKFAEQVFYNRQLASYFENNKVLKHFWADNMEVIDNVYQQIRESDQYAKYMALNNPTYEDDKTIWRQIFSKIFDDNAFLKSCFEDNALYWVSDYDTVISFCIKTIKRFSQDNGAEQPLLPLFESAEDERFAHKLLEAAINHGEEYRELINQRLKNWKLERLAAMDLAIMQTAVAEIMTFSQIPIQVSINEYIELAKEYSSEQSPKFVNGILDDIVKQLKNENRLIKAVII